MPDPAVLYEKEGDYGIIFKGLLRNYEVYKPIIAAVSRMSQMLAASEQEK